MNPLIRHATNAASYGRVVYDIDMAFLVNVFGMEQTCYVGEGRCACSAPTRPAKTLEDVRWTAMTFRTAARKRSFGDRLGAAGARSRSVLRLSTLFRVALER